MRIRQIFLPACLVWLSAPATPVAAQMIEQLYEQCQGASASEQFAPDVRIAACTRLILSGQMSSGDLAIAHVLRGDSYAAQNDNDRALADQGEAIRLNPRYADAFRARALVATQTTEEQMAQCSNRQAAFIVRIPACTAPILSGRLSSGDLAMAHYNRGSSYGEQGDQVRAMADYDEAIRLNPQHAEAYYNRGRSNAARQSYVGAIADYGEAIRLGPQRADAYYHRGYAHRRMSDYVRAMADLDEAIRLNPQNAEAYYNRGITHAQLRDPARAMADYNEAIRLNPQYADAYENRAGEHERLGDAARAAADRAEAARLRGR